MERCDSSDVNVHGKFIADLASKMGPLYELLKDTMDFVFSEDCEKKVVWPRKN